MLLEVLTWTALAMSVVSFALFVVLSLRRTAARDNPKQGPGVEIQPHGINDITELVKAFRELTDSFQKAGPALSALVASILFFLIATLGAGLDKIAK
jgi:predicted secreted protein